MATIGELIQQYGVEYLGRFYSSYRGVVIDNVDPKYMGRILVRIPTMFDGLKVWARPKSSMPGGLLYGLKWITPRKGEIVYVEFEGGNPTKPLWGYHGWAEEEVPEELRDNNTLGLVTPSGNKIYLKEKEGELYIQVNQKVSVKVTDGTSLTMDKENVIINSGSNQGAVNVESLRDLITAIHADLLTAQSGTQVGKWMANGMTEIEDPNFKH